MHEFDRDEIKINCLRKMLLFFWRKAFNFYRNLHSQSNTVRCKIKRRSL